MATALRKAVEGAHMPCVRLLLAQGTNLGSMVPLVYSVMKAAPQMTRALLEGGADPNGAQTQFTPLGTAASMGKVEHVKLLLDAGADRDLKDASGKTVDLAREEGMVECLSLLTRAST